MADLKKRLAAKQRREAKAKAKRDAKRLAAKQLLEGNEGKQVEKGKKVKMAKKPASKSMAKKPAGKKAAAEVSVVSVVSPAEVSVVSPAEVSVVSPAEDPPAEGSSDWEEDDLTPATAPAPEEADENEEVRDLDHLEQLLGGDTQCWEETP